MFARFFRDAPQPETARPVKAWPCQCGFGAVRLDTVSANQPRGLPAPPDPPAFLARMGDAGLAIAAHDWSETPMGFPQAWPPALKVAAGMMLASPIPSFLAWGDEALLLHNDAARALLVARGLGARFDDVFPIPAGLPLLRRARAGESVVQECVGFTRDNGEAAWCNLMFSPVCGDEGQVLGVLVLCNDITARVRQERAHRADERRYQALFESMDEGFCVIEFFDGPHGPDSDYVHIMANAAYERHAGIFNVVGQTLREVVPKEADAWVARYGAVLRTGEPIRFEQELVATGRHLELSSFRIEPPELKQVAVLFQDVTARKRAEADLRGLNETLESRIAQALAERERTEEALRQAQKMEAVGQLTGGLAHDFNNLLAGISGSFEMIGARLAQGRAGEVERYLTAGQGAARRAAALTHRLLAFSRRQTLAPRPMVVNRLLPDFVELVRRTVGPSIKVENVAATGLWPTLVDANQLENALLNLCINARDAMPDGGKIMIETSNRWLDGPAAREHGLDPGQYVSVSVSDTGTGIDKATLERVFDPFFTTKPIGQGTGLGLSMVYGFARQSNGHVRIYSEVGHGTTVCLYLPRHLGEEEVETSTTAPYAPHVQADKTVLVVDDEPTVRMLVVDTLSELGYACLEAPDGAAGLRILQSGRQVDLLITDVGLPGGLNGRQVADGARALLPRLKVLFITGYAENAVLNHGHIEYGMEVLTKPFAVSDLTGRVDRMLGEA
ncbi:PAS domain-containing sensor histidine kinase [Caulobacter vibrioides]|nr:PAS domain-containing sensor histidine kinase [Caulobacter vibrioides]AZH14247.1 PAS domain-containing sensor histidine kinase [Caulobacter vibrioides]PLR11038.1 hybrid sensor histidine kinase/response regulator [Caulobacter vibrioides]